MFGQLVASGWHVAALTMRLMVEARPFGAAPLIGAEVESCASAGRYRPVRACRSAPRSRSAWRVQDRAATMSG